MKKFIVTGLVLIISFLAYGQEQINLNLDKSIDLAIKNNHDLKIASFQKQIAEEQVNEAFGSSLLPQIKGTANYNRALKRGVIIIETPAFSGSFPAGTENTMSVGATLEQPLFTGAVFFATSIANTYAEIAEKSYYSSKAELIKNVTKAYYSFLLSKEFLKLSEITLKSSEDNLKNTEAMYNAGIVPEYDYLRAKVQYQNSLPEVESAKNSITLAGNSLKILLGLELDQQIGISDSIVYNKIEIRNESELTGDLLGNNLTLTRLKMQIDLQDKAVSYQFSKNFPELYLNGNWSSQAQENDPRPINRWRFKNSVYVGFNLKIPLFDGWQTTSRVEQAELDLQIAKETYIKTEKALKNNLDEKVLKLKETEFRVNAYQTAIDQAGLGYEYAKKRYANGIGTQLENVDALVEYTRAKVNYLNSIYSYYSLYADLQELLSSSEQLNNN
jgi:outer membrane protein TolC